MRIIGIAIVSLAVMLFSEAIFHVFPTSLRLEVISALPPPVQRDYINYILSLDTSYFRDTDRKSYVFKVLTKASESGTTLHYNRALLLPYTEYKVFQSMEVDLNLEEAVSPEATDIVLRSHDAELIERLFTLGETEVTPQRRRALCRRADVLTENEGYANPVADHHCASSVSP